MTTTEQKTTSVAPAGSTSVSAMHGRELAFHRLEFAAPRPRWWRLLVVGVVGAALYIGLVLVVVTMTAVVGVMLPGVETMIDRALGEGDVFDLGDPLTFAFTTASLALLIPCLWLATRIVGGKSWGFLGSVAGELRWKWLLRCVLVAGLIYAVVYATSWLVVAAQGEAVEAEIEWPRTLIMVALTLTLVPLQSAAEEYIFRGYLMQLIGVWLRHPAFAILIPVPLFVVGHGYGFYGSVDIALFAVAAGWLTWRTGGLEAAIALHVVNNVSLFVIAHVGLLDINATDTSAVGLVQSLLTTFVFVVVVLRRAPRNGVQRTLRMGSQPEPLGGKWQRGARIFRSAEPTLNEPHSRE